MRSLFQTGLEARTLYLRYTFGLFLILACVPSGGGRERGGDGGAEMKAMRVSLSFISAPSHQPNPGKIPAHLAEQGHLRLGVQGEELRCDGVRVLLLLAKAGAHTKTHRQNKQKRRKSKGRQTHKKGET